MSDPGPEEVSSDEDTGQRTPLERLYPEPIGPQPPTPYLRPATVAVPPSHEDRAQATLSTSSRHATQPATERTAERRPHPGQPIHLNTWRHQWRPRLATHATRLIRESRTDAPAQHQSRYSQIGRGTLPQVQRAHTGHLPRPRVQPLTVLGPHFRFPTLTRLELLRASLPTSVPRPNCGSPRKARTIIIVSRLGYRVRKSNFGPWHSAKRRILEAHKKSLRDRRSSLLILVLTKDSEAVSKKGKVEDKCEHEEEEAEEEDEDEDEEDEDEEDEDEEDEEDEEEVAEDDDDD